MRSAQKLLQYRWRRIAAIIAASAGAVGLIITNPSSYEPVANTSTRQAQAEERENRTEDQLLAQDLLEKLPIKVVRQKLVTSVPSFTKIGPR